MRHLPAFMLCLLAAPALAAGPHPLTDWQAMGGGPVPSWTIADGVITHQPGGGDIETVATFADFTLDFDWRISPGGNSGVFYRVTPDAATAWPSGPEYQILDNAGHPDGQNPLTSAASAYGLFAPSADLTRPVGEWNAGRIVAHGRHVEHWLNGTLVLSYDIGSPEWDARIGASKFRDIAGYGLNASGRIVLQDHGAPISYRNVAVTIDPPG